jgi:hypothetical protein
MLERTDAITEEVLEPITFVLEHPTGINKAFLYSLLMYIMLRSRMLCGAQFSWKGGGDLTRREPVSSVVIGPPTGRSPSQEVQSNGTGTRSATQQCVADYSHFSRISTKQIQLQI